MSGKDLLMRLVHVANQMQDEGADFRDTVYFPDHAALELQDLDVIIEAMKLYLDPRVRAYNDALPVRL